MTSRDGSSVGVIGLGQIGRGVAMTLARNGHRLAVHDVRPDAADGLAGVPALSGSPKEVARAAATILLCVVDAAQLRAVLTGADGVLAGRRPDSMVVVMSTVSLADLRTLRDLAAGYGVPLLDAGVTGGPAAAAAGGLVVFLGADAPEAAAALSVLQDCCATVFHVGGSGAGMAAKIARNVVAYGCYRAAYEGGLLAERSGVDLHQFAAAIRASDRQSGGAMLFVDRRGTVAPVEAPDEVAAALHLARLAAKDLAAAAELAVEVHADLPLAVVTAAHYPDVLGVGTVDDPHLTLP